MDAIFRDNIYSFLRNLDNSKMRRFGKIFHDVTVLETAVSIKISCKEFMLHIDIKCKDRQK